MCIVLDRINVPGPLRTLSEGREAAVNYERGSSDVVGGWTGEEDNGRSEFVRVTGAAGGHPRHLAVEGPLGVLVGHLGREEARSEGYHADALTSGPLDSQVTGQADQACLAGRVGRLRHPAACQRDDT